MNINQRPNARRIAVGLSVFAMLVSAAILTVLLSINPPSEGETAEADATLAQSGLNDLFYRSIGNAEQPAPKSKNNNDIKFTIELAVTQSKDRAEQLIERYAAKGVTAYYTPFSKDGKILYRIRLGLYHSPAKAEADLASLAKQRRLRGKVVRLQ